MDSILITGATGTFGRAFVSYLLSTTGFDRICVYSRGEHAQAHMRATFGDNPRLRFFIGDVRDVDRLKRAMHGISLVVHAAALKRIEVGAYNPDEMVKTNVLGTMNVIEAAISAGVKRVVGLSSDKAFQPISPYGQSKALGESLLLAANDMHGRRTRFAAVRYGNIWKASGSVVPKWESMLGWGLPIPVTDPACTRFFMTIEQAVQLVWDTMCDMKGGELVIPDSLPAYSLGSLAAAFHKLHGCDFKYIGLPEHEKLHESMREGLCSLDARQLSIEELTGFLSVTGEGGR